MFCSYLSQKSALYQPSGELYTHLSTYVHGFMWISVENSSVKALKAFLVDKLWIKPRTYPHNIHRLMTQLSACNLPTGKKSLTNYLHIHRAYYNY
jgi:3-methyladenine DNA glycosylase Mpg